MSTIESQSDDNTVIFEDVTVSIAGNRILDKITARVPKGSCTAIVGPNGAGKTTLLLALLGMTPFEGRINTRWPNSRKKGVIGYVPQRLTLDRGMPMTVAEFLSMGWQRFPLWFGVASRHRQRVRQLLNQVNAEKLETRMIGALSGGELQRVLLALAIGQEPDLLVLDEPAAGVDFQGEYIFCELLDSLRAQKGFTQLMVSHDLSTVTHHANHVICLNRKVAAEGPPFEVLTNETLTAIFGLHMGLVDGKAFPNGKSACTAPCCRHKAAVLPSPASSAPHGTNERSSCSHA